MKLPFVDEVRAARRASEEANVASLDWHAVNASIQTVKVVQQHHAIAPHHITEVPGEELLDTLIEHWPQLANLRDSDLPDAAMAERLQARQLQLQTAKQFLEPIAQSGPERAKVLHELQHRQREALQAPDFSDAVAELGEWGIERDRVGHTIGPLSQRVVMMTPVLAMIDTFQSQLPQRDDDEDPSGATAWRAASVTIRVIEGLRELSQAVQLEIQLPTPPLLPEQPGPEFIEPLWQGVDSVRTQLEALRQAVNASHSEAVQERDHNQARFDELTTKITDAMG